MIHYMKLKTDKKSIKSALKMVQTSIKDHAYFKNIGEVFITNLTPLEIKKLKKKLFGIEALTDVISVNTNDESAPIITGEVFLCINQIRKNSKKFKTNFNEELTRVIIHGLLHIAGFDHNLAFKDKQDEEMFRIQESLVKEIWVI